MIPPVQWDQMTELSPWQARLLSFSRNPVSGYVVLLVLTLLMFGDVLLPGRTAVLGNRYTDVFTQFLAWRQFGFGELAQGHIALWNPHVFAGAPYFGGFQSALLYPPNWLFMVLPVPLAINWSVALHVFLAGAFMNAWALRRGLQPAPACLSGALLMFGGAYFLHIYGGHLTNLCAMVWAPLVFLAIDELFDCGEAEQVIVTHLVGWCLLGAMAANMQVLAGHPQYVFYTAVAAAIYSALRLLRSRRKGAVLASLMAVASGGAALAAVQLVAGLSAASETVRNTALAYRFASAFSLPPENLLTLFAPGLFGGVDPSQYFGRWYLFEMSAFVGVTACVLALYGLVRGSAAPALREHRTFALMVAVLFLLALGVNTPVFHALYSFVPGFDRFRGSAKFIFPATLFMVMLAGAGFDRLLATRHVEGGLLAGVLAAGGVLMVLALVASQLAWGPVLQWTARTNEAYLVGALYRNPAAANELAALLPVAHAAFVKSLLMAGATALVLGAILLAMRRKPQAVWLIGLLALLEVFSFAAASRDTFNVKDFNDMSVKDLLDQYPGDYRIADTVNGNGAMADGASDVGGNDPGVVRRYAELMSSLQGKAPDMADQYLDFSRPHRLYDMLRLRFVFQRADNGHIDVRRSETPMPLFSLMGNFRVIAGRDAIFAAMKDPGFDFRREVILEQQPGHLPSANAEGVVRLLAKTTDAVTFEVDTPAPAILLMTDVYTPSWHAQALPGSVQASYELLPANYVLRAIPLVAGHHRIRVEYRPQGLLAGAMVSIAALLVWSGLAGWLVMRRRRQRLLQ